MGKQTTKKQPVEVLGTFTIAMLTVAAIVSLRNLPLTAELGVAAVFYLILGALIFFIPISLVTAELASSLPEAGGVYYWVSQAFNKKIGFFALWAAWMESITWFPAILIFTATMLSYLLAPVFPGLQDNTAFILSVTLLIFWGGTFINFFGVKTSGWLSSAGVFLGTIIPGFIIIVLGLYWLASDQLLQVDLSWRSFVPEFRFDNVAIFAGVLLGLAGIELSVFHIKEAKEPQRTYPLAIVFALILILLIYILGTLSISMVVPVQEVSLAAGLIQAVQVFFLKLGWDWFVPLVALCLFIGSLASINAWIIGPAKGMLAVAKDKLLPVKLREVNKHHVPVPLLLLQVIIGSVLSLVVWVLQDSTEAIWFLTALAAQFTFVQYFLVFAAALKLRYSKPEMKRPYKVPAIKIVSFCGIATCLFCFFIVYAPPSFVKTISVCEYELGLIITLVLLSLPPFLFIKLVKK